MKLLFVVDGRSPIALNWISFFVETGHEVHLASIYPCQPELDLASLTIIPVAFSSAVEVGGAVNAKSSLKNKIVRKLASPGVRTWLRHQFVPRSLPEAAAKLQSLIAHLQPDLIHTMRIPYEGMLAALACASIGANSPPLLISIWGNDFTLHAPATRRLTYLTRLTLQQADALHTDCQRDFKLAQDWGFDATRPGVVLPGAGGIQSDIFFPGDEPRQPVVINPRGLRAYVQNDTFFKAIPRILAQQPQTQFLCPVMQGQPEAELWASRLGAGESLKLLPRLSRKEIAATFRQSQIVLSITTHDGTPNTLLEALACGCFPIVGDIESLREWVQPGVNGFLVDPLNPEALAEAVLAGLADPELRARARRFNTDLIAEKAEFGSVMGQAQTFYDSLLR
jgi:glycosyltransferase involved in cell wall biosynthesis